MVPSPQNEQENESMLVFLIFMAVFTFIYFTNALIKFYLFCVEKRQTDFMFIFEKQNRSVKNNFFWRSFLIDFVTFQVPIILYVTVLDDYKVVFFLALVLVNVFVYKSITSESSRLISVDLRESNSGNSTEAASSQANLLDDKLIRISVNGFRSLLFLITSVCILAVDFSLFPSRHHKSGSFGISLMDIGVGFFILCHSMRLIRNSSAYESSETSFKKELKSLPKKIFQTAKKSSILLIIGCSRFILVSLTHYKFSYSEYGLHWNFFFTIFFVKLLACPFDLFIRKSSIRSFVLSIAIGLTYEYLLIRHNLAAYLLDSELDHRVSLIDKNKEGLFSLVGYLAIYFAGEAICYRLKYIIQDRAENGQVDKLGLAKRCTFDIGVMALVYWAFMELARVGLQDVSRKMCNLAFVFFIMTSATALWMSICVINLVMAKIVLKLLAGNEKLTRSKTDDAACVFFLENAFSFVDIVDSKMIGLSVFLVSNIFTGLVNLSLDTKRVPTILSLLILFLNSLVSTFLPFLVFFYLFVRKNSNK